ncbi:MAG: hypothetical protein I8H75_05030 [Myxococcaceae bacterium]|nr:hypothetical protein [Myxococcaceae bacterium]
MYFFIILILAPAANALEYLTWGPVQDSAVNALYQVLPSYRCAPTLTSEELQATAKAASAILTLFAPQIKNHPSYTGVFTCNCTIHFNQRVQQANCNWAPATAQQLSEEAVGLSSVSLPSEQSEQILFTHLLLAHIFADWTKNKKQQFQTDLFLRPQTLTTTPFQSSSLPEPQTDSLKPIATETPSDSPKPTVTQTLAPSKTGFLSRTFSAIASATQTLTSWTQSISNSQVFSSSWTSTPKQSASYSQTPEASDSFSASPTRADSISQTDSVSHSQSDSFRASFSHTKPLSTTLSPIESLSPSIPELIVVNPEYATWNASTGVYDDATNQTGRYSLPWPGIVYDSLINRYFTQSAVGTDATFAQATQLCADLRLGGFSDWRVPEVIELQMEMDLTRMPMLHPIFNISGSQWANGIYIRSSNSNWNVYFNANQYDSAGTVYYLPSTWTSNTTCVRGKIIRNTIVRYQDAATRGSVNQNTTEVLDTATNLVWARSSGGDNLIWNTSAPPGSFQAYCHNLTLRGAPSQVPTTKQMSTLRMLNNWATTIDATVFSNIDNSTGYGYYATALDPSRNDIRGSYIPYDGQINGGAYHVLCVHQ